jgi:YspA, cpYpsA-related SLOG family
MRVLVTGGRDFSNRELLFEILDRLHAAHTFTVLIHGDANGADRLAGEWGVARGVTVEAHPADWKKHGRAAGPIRNQKMLEENLDLVVAFPGGRGTADMVRKARKTEIDVFVVEPIKPS